MGLVDTEQSCFFEPFSDGLHLDHNIIANHIIMVGGSQNVAVNFVISNR